MFAATEIALRGRVTGGNLQTQVRSAGDARYGWDDAFALQTLPAMIATGGGNRIGFALYQANNNLAGGVMSGQLQGQGQEKWACIRRRTSCSTKRGFGRGSRSTQSDTLRKNPLTRANDYREKLKGMGVDVDDPAQMQQVIGEIGRGNKGLKTSLDELLLPQTNRQLNKEMANIRG
jgi:hypothetical protein